MTTLLEELKTKLDSLLEMSNQLLSRSQVAASQVVTTSGLSDISTALGLVTAGEFRSGKGSPGSGFTGVRIGSPGWTYSGIQYSIVGMKNDVLQFGMSTTDGTIYAGQGVVRLNADGIYLRGDGTDKNINSFRMYFDDSGTDRLMGYIYSDYGGGPSDPAITWITSLKGSTDPWPSAGTTLSASNSVISANSSRMTVMSDGTAYVYTGTFSVLAKDRTGLTSETAAKSLDCLAYSRTFDAGSRVSLVGHHFHAPTFVAASASSITTRSANVFIEGAPTLTDFTVTDSRNYALAVLGDAWISTGGLDLHNGRSATDGSMSYSGDLMAYRNSTNYTGYVFVPLTTPLTSTSWDGDSFSTTAKTIIDLSSVFSVPAGVKAVLVKLSSMDSASSTTNCYVALSPNNTAGDFAIVCKPYAMPNDTLVHINGIVPCDSNGDIYYQCEATGAGTLDIHLQIHGYWI